MKSFCIKTIDKDKIEYLIRELEVLPFNIYMSNYRFKTYDNLIIHYPSKEYIDEFCDVLSLIIKKCIEKFYKEKFIMRIVEKNYFYLNSLEKKYIVEITKKVLELPDEKIGYINTNLKKVIKNYIIENKKIVLEGFVNFRMKDYKELLDRIVEVSVFSYLNLITF